MNSKRPVAPEGFEPQSRNLMVVARGKRPSGLDTKWSLFTGMAWCLFGSFNAAVLPVLSCALIAFGMIVLMRSRGRRGEVLALLASLGASAAGTSLLVNPFGIPSAVVMVLCAYAVAKGIETGRLKTGYLLLVGVVTTAAMLGIDVVSTSLSGTSIAEVVTSVVDGVVESSAGQLDLDGKAALLETREQLVVFWPTIYFVTGMGAALCSLFGSLAGMRSAGAPVARGVIVRYDVPLWVPVAFALGVAAELLGPRLPLWADEVAVVGANVVLCARIVLAQQGLSVLQWWLHEHRVNPFARATLVLVGVWLELSFALTSVVGLLDVVANFRHLERNRADLMWLPTEKR